MTCPCCEHVTGCGYCDDRDEDVSRSLLAQVAREITEAMQSGRVRVVPERRERLDRIGYLASRDVL